MFHPMLNLTRYATNCPVAQQGNSCATIWNIAPPSADTLITIELIVLSIQDSEAAAARTFVYTTVIMQLDFVLHAHHW